MGKKLNLILAIRLHEQLSELVETYGVENVREILVQFQAEKPKEKAAPPVDKAAEEQKAKQLLEAKLPPNIKNIEQFEAVINDFAAKGKIKPEVYQGLKGFIENAKLISVGQYKKVNESFIINLTSKPDSIQAQTPEEDWIKYNGETIRKHLKQKLRLVGYDFLDSEAEVGKSFDVKRHNIVGKEVITESALDKRVLKVTNEGLIIGRKLHINANVIIGSFQPNN